MSGPYEMKHVKRDGVPTVLLRCPNCKTLAELDDDQYHGRVSIECQVLGCGFHETINLASEEKS